MMRTGLVRRFWEILLLGSATLAQVGSPATTHDWPTLLLHAARGQAQAQYELGRRFDLGIGVAQSDQQALRYYRQAAARNLPVAQYRLGCKYWAGEGVTQDRVAGLAWFRLAAVQNHPLAQNRLGRIFEFGQGVERDLVQAYTWYTRASRNPRNIYAMVNRNALAQRMPPEQIFEAEMLLASMEELKFSPATATATAELSGSN